MPPLKEGLARTLAASVREYVEAAEKRIIEILEKRIERIPHGPKGDKGEPGEAGIGIPGKDGADGKNGRDGIDGKDGAPGLDGRSITGMSGTDGAPGKDGRDGIDGQPGTDGKDAPIISIWPIVDEVIKKLPPPAADGKDGRDGRDGKDGINGRDGDSGRDALALDILPGIDPAKTYLRGTFARDRGGIVRFNGHEWEVIVDGLAGIEILDTEDPRELKVVFTRTSGHKSILERRVPYIDYRNIWLDTEEYDKGDVVTWNGSAWHCERKTTQKPGTGNDWTLMVKEGRRGKDADAPKPTNGDRPVRLQ